MKASVLVDTGALLALLDSRDHWHGNCVNAFRELRLPLATSEAVLTELFHLVGDSVVEMEAAWRRLRSGAIEMAVIGHGELGPIQALMSKYADRPMDFADATLVYLAGREGITSIFTVDHDDFGIYRVNGRRKFRLVPSDRTKRHGRDRQPQPSPAPSLPADTARRLRTRGASGSEKSGRR